MPFQIVTVSMYKHDICVEFSFAYELYIIIYYGAFCIGID